MRGLVVALLLLLTLPIVGTGPAAADDLVLPDGSYTYEGTRTFTSLPADGTGTPSTSTTPGSALVACEDGACSLRLFDPRAPESVPVAPDGSVSWSRPDDFVCRVGIDSASTGSGAATVTGSVTETTLEYRYELERVDADEPDGDGHCTGSGHVTTFSGTRESGSGGPGRGAGSASRLDTGEADAPSVLSAMPKAQDVEGRNALLGAVLAVVLVILVAFPTALLNSATERGSDRLSAWWRGRAGEASGSVDPRWWWAAAGVLAAGAISAFVDPQLGFNAGSVRTLASVLVAFGLETILGWLVVVWLVRRVNPGVAASYSFRPATLVVVVLAVVLSRVTEFEPGIVFGLVAGVAFPALASAADNARKTLIALGWAFGLALVAWLAYSQVSAPSNALGVFGVETLAAVAATGMAALPIALFPVRGMPGRDLFEHSRGLWMAAYTVGLAGFLVVLMPMPASWGEVDWSLRAWVIGYLAYLGAALLAWVLVRVRDDEPADPGPAPVNPGG